MYKVIYVLALMFIPFVQNSHASNMFACIEKGAAGFDAEKNMKETLFSANAKFILKYDDKTPKLISEDKFLPGALPQICSTNYTNHGITCMDDDGRVLMHFNEADRTYRWVLFGSGGDDTVITHGSCEKYQSTLSKT